MKPRIALVALAIVPVPFLATACRSSHAPAAHGTTIAVDGRSVTPIDPNDTAAYSVAGSDIVAAVARCRPPACRPDIFRGPAPGELTVGLDSGKDSEFQWQIWPDTVIGISRQPQRDSAWDATQQDSAWGAMLKQWATAKSPRLLLVDGVPRTYAYVRVHVRLSSVWGMQELSATQARAVSSDPAAANGAIAITTKAHAPASR